MVRLARKMRASWKKGHKSFGENQASRKWDIRAKGDTRFSLKKLGRRENRFISCRERCRSSTSNRRRTTLWLSPRSVRNNRTYTNSIQWARRRRGHLALRLHLETRE